MTAWVWLLGAAFAAAGACAAGWPAWSAYRSRRNRDLNAERYLAWRGRAGERSPESRPTRGEQRRLIVAALLGLAAAFCLVGFFTYL